MLYFDRNQVCELLSMNACIEVMRDLFAHHCRDVVINPLRSKMWLPENVGVMGIMPAYIKALGVMGIKVITVFPDNYKKGISSHQGQVLLFEAETGKLLAAFDGGEITAIRTAAVSAVATQALAREDARHLALIGTGELAITHLEAISLVRKIEKVTVFSPTRAKMEAFAETALQKLNIRVELKNNAAEAVADADIICTLTPSRTPVLQNEWVKAGAHINAVGSSTPVARELDGALVARSRLFVDNLESAMNEAGDILIPIQEGLITEKHIVGNITDLLNKKCEGRRSPEETTLFKSLGIAIEDVASAFYIYQKAINEAAGKDILIDLSHTIEHGLVTYKGLPAPIICDYLSREKSRSLYGGGAEFQIGKIEMVSNTGTYIDCPFHRFEHGKDLSEVGLEHFADLEGVVIRVPFEETLEITEEHLKNREIRNRAVLIHTGWDAHWNTERYYENHPYLTAGAAAYLRDCGVKLVGIDSHNIDSTLQNTRPVHTILLGAEILIVEHLCNLYLLPEEGFTFSAIPPKFKGVGTFPVRAMAKVRQAL